MAAMMVQQQDHMEPETHTHLTAARARALTTAEWQARALALAEQNHLLYRARYLGEDADGCQRFETPSKSAHDQTYVQRVNPMAHVVSCTCRSGDWSLPCCHAGAALHAWGIVERAMAAALADYQRTQHWAEYWAQVEQSGHVGCRIRH